MRVEDENGNVRPVGSVSSVAADSPDGSVVITGSPITSSGTFHFTLHPDLLAFIQNAGWNGTTLELVGSFFTPLDLTVNGSVQIGSDLNVDGAVSFPGATMTLGGVGFATVGTTVTVTGSQIVTSDLTIQGDTIMQGDATVTGGFNASTANISILVASPRYAVGTATISSGAGVPAAAEPDGSLYLRTGAPNGSLYVRQNSAWKLVTVT